MITKAYLMRGIGDALNARDFLFAYCEQKYIRQKDITIFTSLHKNIFEDTEFRIEPAEKIDPRQLVLYGNFGNFDLPKTYFCRRFDECIAVNARINYSFEKIYPLNWKADISHLKLPERFITVNYGHDNHSNPRKICTKMWSMKYWEALVSMLKIPCVQVGAGWSCKPIKGVTLNLVDKLSLKQSAEVMRKALFHIDIEGGLVILNYHIGVKSVVLFGPTDPKHFGKKGNLNLRRSNCNPCSGAVDITGQRSIALYVWRHPCQSRCMETLTPDYVLDKIKQEGWLK